MIVRAVHDESAYGAASADYMRSMLGVGGRLLASIASDRSPRSTLERICAEARQLLGAEWVAIELAGAAADAMGDDFVVVAGSAGPPERTTVLLADIAAPGALPWGTIQIGYPCATTMPSPLHQLTAHRFAAIAVLALQRHLSRRRQLQAIAREREQLAGDIHDDSVQAMTAVSLRLQRLASRLPAGPERTSIEQTRRLTDEAIDRLRHVMFSQYPETLVEDGLTAAIEAYCTTYVETEAITCVVDGPRDESVPLEMGALAFRLCCNALHNAVTHAHASAIRVHVEVDDTIRVVVSDDGVGFDLSEVSRTRVGHFGIPHAVSIASSAAGSYETVSEPGEGTTVTITLPRV